jgi:7-cyano-7-deazaguanine synthase
VRTVLLLSGGLDSVVLAAHLHNQGHELYGLTLDYGQRHWKEMDCAHRQGRRYCVETRRLELPLGKWLKSPLLEQEPVRPMGADDNLSPAYVPGRNTLFLSLAFGYAQSLGAGSVAIAATAEDRYGFPDCRPGYFRAWDRLLAEAGASKPVSLLRPMEEWSKAQVVGAGVDLGVDLGDTWSCYTNGPKPCGACDACTTRARGFTAAGIKDPLLAPCCACCGD